MKSDLGRQVRHTLRLLLVTAALGMIGFFGVHVMAIEPTLTLVYLGGISAAFIFGRWDEREVWQPYAEELVAAALEENDALKRSLDEHQARRRHDDELIAAAQREIDAMTEPWTFDDPPDEPPTSH